MTRKIERHIIMDKINGGYILLILLIRYSDNLKYPNLRTVTSMLKDIKYPLRRKKIRTLYLAAQLINTATQVTPITGVINICQKWFKKTINELIPR
jgi:hypothetical protein